MLLVANPTVNAINNAATRSQVLIHSIQYLMLPIQVGFYVLN